LSRVAESGLTFLGAHQLHQWRQLDLYVLDVEERVAVTSRLATSLENPSVSWRWMRHERQPDEGVGTLGEPVLDWLVFGRDTSCSVEAWVPESAGSEGVATKAVLAKPEQPELSLSGLPELCSE
jgi:hypothetical protein